MEKPTAIFSLLGCLPRALAWNFVIGVLALMLSISLGGPRIYIELNTAIIVFCLLLVPYVAITWWSIGALAKGQAKENLITSGPYGLVRDPMYAAVIFILNPALGILFRSWLLLLATIPAYFVWRKCIKKEEERLTEKFGQAYVDYQQKVWRFFPNLYHIKPALFYVVAGLAIFVFSFIYLNYSAFYLRWVIWDSSGQITYDKPNSSSFSGYFSRSYVGQKASYNPGPNTITISKISVRAPVVNAVGPSQSEINQSLNQGVVLYPGSAAPGQAGEVFLTAHSSVFPWNKTEYGQIFTLLDKLVAGDVVSVVYNNYQYDYRITGKAVLGPDQVKISLTNEPKITLMTCWPIGTALKRLVVYGELIK